MKKILFLILAVLFAVQPAYALQCKDGQSQNSDECWTEVKIGKDYTTLVSRGHVLVVSMVGASVSDNDGYLARISGASTDEEVLGVAQRPIASGESALVLYRGRGVVKYHDFNGYALASGDVLGVHTSGTVTEVATTSHLGKARAAVALEGTPESNGNVEAYILG